MADTKVVHRTSFACGDRVFVQADSQSICQPATIVREQPVGHKCHLIFDEGAVEDREVPTGWLTRMPEALPIQSMQFTRAYPPAATITVLDIDGVSRTFSLSVAKSLIPGAGLGMFIEYVSYFTNQSSSSKRTGGHVEARFLGSSPLDIGMYAPFRAADVKPKFVFMAKNYLFGGEPEEWSYRAIQAEKASQGVARKKRARTASSSRDSSELTLDITDDSFGRPHRIALGRFPMFVNEVGRC
jgi:hypothetical protein